jgi:hypothetical protein
MDILINSQNYIRRFCDIVGCACFGEYFNCPYDGCPSYSCSRYSFCDTKGGGNPCIVSA